ncbi:MAG TPA: hypothetical protein VIG33_17580 [Pseudobdellovibrionaceae bacterium]|jgi:hypothetical protein
MDFTKAMGIFLFLLKVLKRHGLNRCLQFQSKRMHIDGLQEIQAVDGFKVFLEHDASLNAQTHIINFKHRDLAPKPAVKSEEKKG